MALSVTLPITPLLLPAAAHAQFVAQSSTAALWTVNNASPAATIGTNPNWTTLGNIGWMGPVANSHTNNIGIAAFTYSTTFDLTNHQRLTFQQNIDTLADDQVAGVSVNGTAIPFRDNGFNSPGGFTISGASGLLRPGINTVSIIVNNLIVSPTGLAVRNDGGTATPIPSYSPPPNSFVARNVLNLPEGNSLSADHFLFLSQPFGWRLASVAPNTAAVVAGNPQGATFSFAPVNTDLIGIRGTNAVRGTTVVLSGPVNITSTLISDPAYTRNAFVGDRSVQVNVFNVTPVIAPLESPGFDLNNIPKRRLISYRLTAFDPGAFPLDIVADGTTFNQVTRGTDGQTRLNFTNVYTRSGQYTIPISVSDGLASAFSNTTITVRNNAPEVRQLRLTTGTTTTDIVDGSTINIAPSTPYTLSTSLFDADGDILTTTWTVGSEVALTTNFLTSQITLTPPPGGLNFPITLTTSDDDAPPVIRTFLLTTNPPIIPEPSTALLALTPLPLLTRTRRHHPTIPPT